MYGSAYGQVPPQQQQYGGYPQQQQPPQPSAQYQYPPQQQQYHQPQQQQQQQQPAANVAPNGTNIVEPEQSATDAQQQTIYVDTQHDDMIHDAQLDYYGTKLATCSSGTCIFVKLNVLVDMCAWGQVGRGEGVESLWPSLFDLRIIFTQCGIFNITEF